MSVSEAVLCGSYWQDRFGKGQLDQGLDGIKHSDPSRATDGIRDRLVGDQRRRASI